MKWDNGVDEPRYWLIMFTQWGVGAYGEQGSFAYDRYEILESVYVEQPASSNPNAPQVIDVISDGVHITRRYTAVDNNSYQDSIYNIVSEPFAVGGGVSPRNTKWNSIFTDTRPNYSGYTDLSNLESRVYVDFIGALNGDFNNILSTELIMHDMTTDLYHKVQFTDWSEACDLPTGAVVSYNVIQEGIGYPDAGVGANPWLILTAEGGSGSGLEIGLGSISGTTYTSYIQENATGYQVGDILTFPYPGVTDVYTIEITAVADVCISGGFAYTRTVIPQSEGIKFADQTVLNTAPVIPAPTYKVYTALLTQTGTDAPVATVLENTLGEEIIWVRNDVGDYQADCSLLVDTEGYADNKAFSNIFGYNTIQGSDSVNSTTAKYSEQWFETGVIKLTTVTSERDGSSGILTFADDLLYFMPIEIRVYN
jgi:hypothetical protein